jgi:hypothetical protein
MAAAMRRWVRGDAALPVAFMEWLPTMGQHLPNELQP